MSTPKLITVTWRLERSYMEFIKILVKIVLRWGVRSAWRIVTFIWKEVTIATLTFRKLKRKTLVPEHPYNIKSRVVKLNRFFWLQILVPVAWGPALWGTASSRGFRTATQSSGRIRTWTGSSSSSRRRKGSPKRGSMRAQSWNSQTGSPSWYTMTALTLVQWFGCYYLLWQLGFDSRVNFSPTFCSMETEPEVIFE